MTRFISEYFNFQEKNTNFKTETIAGITTFLTMAYALFLTSYNIQKTIFCSEYLRGLHLVF